MDAALAKFKETPPGPEKWIAARAVAALAPPFSTSSSNFHIVVDITAPHGYYWENSCTGPGWEPIQISKEVYETMLSHN